MSILVINFGFVVCLRHSSIYFLVPIILLLYCCIWYLCVCGIEAHYMHFLLYQYAVWHCADKDRMPIIYIFPFFPPNKQKNVRDRTDTHKRHLYRQYISLYIFCICCIVSILCTACCLCARVCDGLWMWLRWSPFYSFASLPGFVAE